MLVPGRFRCDARNSCTSRRYDYRGRCRVHRMGTPACTTCSQYSDLSQSRLCHPCVDKGLRSEERRVGKVFRSLCDWSSDVCSSDLNGVLRADYNACWFQADFGAMRAIVALRGGMTIGVDVECIVWARLHARLAANTAT